MKTFNLSTMKLQKRRNPDIRLWQNKNVRESDE
jgi:hypothetical protein